MNNLPPDPGDENGLAIQLMARYQKGDGDAFTQLYELYQRRLLWFLSRSLAKREDVWDVSQNVWVRIHRTSRFNFRVDGCFYSWLRSQARSELSMFIERRDPALASIDEVSESELSAPDDQNFYSLIEAIDTLERLKAAIDKLAPIYREVIILRFFDEKSTDECARLLLVPVGTIYRRQHVAIHKLQEMLER